MRRLVEIRAYALKPGTASEFHELVKTAAVPMLRAFGMDVVAFGPSAHDGNAYFLIRAYDDLADLQSQQDAFYGSEPWLRGPRESIVSRIESYLNTVVWLSPESIDDLRHPNGAAARETPAAVNDEIPTGSSAHIPFLVAAARIPDSATTRSLALFRHGTLLVKYYAPRGNDLQTPHTRDELYVVAQGRGVFFNGTSRQPFVPGDLLFAAANAPHRFEEFTDDFGVWVMFYGPENGEAGGR